MFDTFLCWVYFLIIFFPNLLYFAACFHCLGITFYDIYYSLLFGDFNLFVRAQLPITMYGKFQFQFLRFNVHFFRFQCPPFLLPISTFSLPISTFLLPMSTFRFQRPPFWSWAPTFPLLIATHSSNCYNLNRLYYPSMELSKFIIIRTVMLF